MKINEISASDVLTQGFIAKMLEYCPLLRFLEFYSITGGTDNPRKKNTVAGDFIARDLNEPITTPVVANPLRANIALKIFSRELTVDTAHEERQLEVASELQTQLMNFAEEIGRGFADKLIRANSGTAEPKWFRGMYKLVADEVAAGQTSQLITYRGNNPAPTNGGTVLTGNSDAVLQSHQRLLEDVRRLIRSISGGAQALMMNGDLHARFLTIASAMNSLRERDVMGQMLPTFDNVPILDAGYRLDGSSIMPSNEVVGTKTDCTSILAFRAGERADLACATTRVGFVVYPVVRLAQGWVQLVQGQMDTETMHNRSVARLQGIGTN
jgi:hypothetical protein